VLHNTQTRIARLHNVQHTDEGIITLHWLQVVISAAHFSMQRKDGTA